MKTELFLKESGFTEYEIKVYLALAQLGTAKASLISKRSGVPANKVYECLIHLVERGFVSSLDLTPRQFKIHSLERFESILEEREKNFQDMKVSLTALKQQIKSQTVSGESTALVLMGKQRIVDKLNEITPSITKYQYGKGGRLTFYPKSARTVREAIARGVDVRFLVHYDQTHEPDIQKWRDIGVKIRFHPKSKQESIRFSIFDDKICRITFGTPEISREEDFISFWIESPGFASLLKDQFLEMWKKAKE